MSLKEVQGSEQFSIILADRSFKGSEQKALDVDPNTGSVTVGAGDLVVATGRFRASAKDAITAKAGGGQSGATLLATDLNRVTTVGTAADSAILPKAKAGMEITVMNAAANSLNVFPAVGEQINAIAVNGAFAVAGAKTATFYCAKNGQWHTILSA